MASWRLPSLVHGGRRRRSAVWRREFIRSTVERDLPQLGVNVAAPALYRFWAMLAHYHGQVWNAAEPARSLGVNESTVRRYLDLLTQAYLIRQAPALVRQSRQAPGQGAEDLFRDSGLLHSLLGIDDPAALARHPKSGASWEGFALDQVMRIARHQRSLLLGDTAGAELDLLMIRTAAASASNSSEPMRRS